MHAGSSEWFRTHALPFSRAFVGENINSPPLVKEIPLVVSRSCHFSSLNFQGLCFNSFGARLWAPALRKSPIIFKRMYLQKVGAHHFLEEFGWAHVPWDSYRILLYIYYWGSNILGIGCAYVDIFWKKHVCFFWAHPMSSYEIPFSRDLICLPFSREIKKHVLGVRGYAP